jgi:YD repeat-containing protein
METSVVQLASSAVQIESSAVGYYTTEAVHFTQTDGPNGVEQATFDYADKFSDGNSTPVSYNTFAYPTKVTDPDGFESNAEYRYDFGAPVKATGPPPAGQSAGAIVRRVYDTIGRLEKVRTEFNGNPDYSYTRWTYPSTNTKVSQYTTITDGAGEAFSFTQTDGLGRVTKTATEHPGSAGGFSTVATEYDALGRPFRQSVPTETDQFTNPGGDDAAGYLYREQTYDWKGRPLITTNTDGTQRELQYGGCGCAGGEVVTLIGENLAGPNEAVKRRKQMIYSDFLGRTVKAETYNWPAPYGDGAVYSSVVTDYNARDQVRFVKQYAGPASGTPGLQTEIQYDGHGRQSQVHRPEMDADRAFSYEYNANDTLHLATDARGVKTTYTYNNRRLITELSFDKTQALNPASIAETGNVSFTYDAAGNRTSMTDASGSIAYTYDQYSRLVTEAQTFAGLSGTYHLNYAYSVGGTLTSLTDEFNTTLNYAHDRIGRLTAVTGAGLPNNVTQLANNYHYRAWGGIKDETYGNGKTLTMTYNARLQAASYNIPGVLGGEYQYHADGALKFMHDLDLTRDGKFDRSYAYDHVGRLEEAKTGNEARGDNGAMGPYLHTYYYDAFNNTNLRDGRHWSHYLGDGWDYYVNQRNTDWQYDSDGRITQQGETLQHTYDAAGRFVTTVDSTPRGNNSSPRTVTQTYDGVGRIVKRQGGFSTYYLKSSVLGGQVIAEIDENGQRRAGNIYGGRGLLAKIEPFGGEGPVLRWVHRDAANTREAKTNPAGGNEAALQFDPLGASVGWEDRYVNGNGRGDYTNNFPSYGDADDFSGGCTLDGIIVPCSWTARLVGSGAAIQGYDGLLVGYNKETKQTTSVTPITITPEFEAQFGRYINGPPLPSGLIGSNTWVSGPYQDTSTAKDPVYGPANGVSSLTISVSFDSELLIQQGLDKFGRSQYFNNCANGAGLGGFLSEDVWNRGFRFNDEGAKFINRIIDAEPNSGVSAGLLGFTFWEEGKFDINQGPNQNKDLKTGAIPTESKWDWGPFQLNYEHTQKDLKAGDYSDKGLSGYFPAAVFFVNGSYALNTFDNGRLAVRKLRQGLIVGGGKTNKEKIPVEEYSAGYFTGGGRVAIRREHWRQLGGAFTSFFNCYNWR